MWLKCGVLLLLACGLSIVQGFVNSPKIITKDGNLIFESGSNRNISIRLSGKSRLIINDEYDVLELLLSANTGSAGGIKKRINGPKDEWGTVEDITDLRELAEELAALRLRAFGSNGLNKMLRQLQNRTRVSKVMLRRYQTRLRNVEVKVQRLTNQLELNSCQSSPCENGGTCYNTFNGFRCQCRSAFEGAKCERDVNECALYEGTDLGCQNRAECINQFGSFSCICEPGWYGVHCTQRKGDCSQSSVWELCGHGSCVASSDTFGYKCLCEAGWRTNGLTPACTVDVDECESNTPCLTKCINLPGSFTCAPCPAGLTGNGVVCRDINECETNNGGCSVSPTVACMNSYGSYHCGECPLGWRGDGRICVRSGADDGTSNAGLTDNSAAGIIRCAQKSYICHPAATCLEVSGTIVCSCPNGMVGSGIGSQGCLNDTSGTAAQPLPLNPCAHNPCRNGGLCRALGNGIVCRCQPGYRGRLCDQSFSVCNAMMSGPTGRLRYPPEGTGYEHNAQCAWIIRTNESMVLNVTFNSFELEDSTDCRFDWLQLNDGRTAAAQIIGRYCGSHRPRGGNIITSTNYLYLWFRSDNSTSKEGFDLVWHSIPPQCGGLLNFETHGTIATPGSPGNYPPNRECEWHLRAPLNKRIKLTFFSLQIEKHEDCNFDYVAINDAISGRQLYKFCSSSQPAPLLLPTNEANVVFHSDDEDSDAGFQLHYSAEERVPGCGGVYTAREGIIKAPIYDGDEVLSCEYEINMAIGESVLTYFTDFKMGADECLEIYDVNESEKILQSKHCGGYTAEGFMPPTYSSLYNRLLIKYYGRSGRFDLHYRMDCSATFEGSIGTISTPGYPNLTNSDRFCSYKILTDPNTVIVLNRVDFQLLDNALDLDEDDKAGDCATTYLRINDGLDRNILGPFCDENVPDADYVSKTNMLMLHFQSGSTSSGRGFKFNYKAVPVGKNDCGGVYTKPNQTIRVPTADEGGYMNDMTCYWIIMAPRRKGILLKWNSFKLEASADCSFDYVEIYDNLAKSLSDRPLARYCDLMPPADFISHSRMLTIKFVSDFSETSDGFELTYEFVDKETCGGHIHSSYGRISSPDFPHKYSNGLDCEWIITAPINTKIELQVEEFELEDTPNCTGDWLSVHNGAHNSSFIIGRFCGSKMPKRIPSFTNEMYLHFHTDSFVNGPGFFLDWHVYASGCGGVLHSDSGVITSPRYPNPYPADAQCEWQVLVHPGSAIRFVVEDLVMEGLFDCYYDFVKIYEGNGPDQESPLRLLCDHIEEPVVIESSRHKATVIFHSDSSNEDRGFRMSYSADCWRNLTDVEGVIESLNFGEDYFERGINCSWTIHAPGGNSILIEFSHLEQKQSGADFGKPGLLFLETKNGKIVTQQAITEMGVYNVTTGDALTIVHNSSNISFRLEYRVIGCMQILRGENNSFQSPNYPGMYPNNAECYWVIHAEPGNNIELSITDLDLEESVNCTKDALVISNHAKEYSIRERHCGRIPTLVMTSAGHHMHVRFITDAEHNGLGFKATYRIKKAACGGKITAKNGIIQSPQYPLPYPVSSNCEWIVEVSEHHNIIFELEDMELEVDFDCSWDYLEAFDIANDSPDQYYEGNQIFRLCEMPMELQRFNSSSNMAIVRFVSDDSVQHKGFMLLFHESCGERLLVDELDFFYTEIKRHTPRHETCVWQLVAVDPAKHILFTPTHVLLNAQLSVHYPTESDCMEKGIKVYDGTLAIGTPRLKYCNKHPPAIISHGNALTITVPFDLISEFEGHVMTMDTACGSYYDSISGKFTTPYYPNSYPVNIECEWNIVASAGNSIVLTFESMDLEQSDGCNNDYVEVREDDNRGKLLGAFCGNTVPPAMEGKGALWIKFKSNNDVVGQGFMASHNYERHNELSGTNGTVESPRYPSVFHDEQPYSWRITVDKEYVVLLNIVHLVDVDQSYIHFFDGYSDIGAKLDYSRSHMIRSNTNILFMTAKRGPFQVQWERLSKEELRSNRTAEEQSRLCGRQVINVNSTIVFNSPGYPTGYAPNLQCSWTFVPSDPAMHAVIQISKVDLEEFSQCFADYITISSSSNLQNWQELIKTCRKPNASELLYHGKPFLKLDFVSDVSINETGFSTTVRTECGSALTEPRGLINITRLVTPTTLFGQECVWTIRVRQGRRIRINFLESLIRDPARPTDVEVCRTFFLVRNGFAEDSPFLGRGKYCDNNITDVLETTANMAYIKFKRVGYLRFLATFRYEEISHACSDEIVLSEEPGMNSSSRVISSPNFPNLPNPHSECVWRITAPRHHIIAIDFFNVFDLTPGTDPESDACDREYVQLNDGSTEVMPMIGRYCGKQKPDTIYSTGNVLRLKYFTDVSEPRQGFQVRVSLGLCGGSYYSSEGTISSPKKLQLDHNKRDFECVYTINVEKGSTISLKFDSISLPVDANCSEHTHLQLDEIEPFGFEGEEKISDTLLLCGTDPKHYIVETNKVVIRLRLPEGVLGERQGFTLNYKAIGARCSETIIANGGVLQSPGYPEGVQTPTYCNWKLQVPKGKRVKVEMIDFDTGTGNSSTSRFRTFRGRLTFANDFRMQSIIGRYSDSPPVEILSTDNTMGIDAFLLPLNRHRGFKLRFSASGVSECGSRLPLDQGGVIQISSSGNKSVHCSWELNVPENQTLLLQVTNVTTRIPLMNNPYVCAAVSMLKLHLNDVQLLPKLLCDNTTTVRNVRLPFPVQMQISINKRNEFQQIELNYKSYPCGGIMHLDLGDNMTIEQPLMPADFGTGQLDCAWAIWPPSFSEDNIDDIEYWVDSVQIEISLNVNLTGDCNDHYLLLYNGPDQNSPHLGRYCSVASMANLVVERGLFFEYHSEHYDTISKFNLSVKHGSGCGGKISYPYRQIIFGEQYKNNVECVWEIETDPGFHVGLTFVNRFFIESSNGCSKDYLKVQQRNETNGEWTDIQTLCGRESPKSVNTTTPAMRLIFRSDGDTIGDGFTAKFERNCGGLLYATSTPQQLTSPGYPQKYEKNLYCNYTILPLEQPSPGVLVRFLDFYLEHPPMNSCSFDNVTISTVDDDDGVHESVICGVKVKHEYRGKKSVTVLLRTDMSFSGKGFKLDYSTNLCGGVVSESSIVASPRQHTDNKFPPSSKCYWNLTAPAGHKFTIKFEMIDYESQQDCIYDGVEVFSGSVPLEAQRLGRFCGNLTSRLPTLSIPTNRALIHSYSDASTESNGFRALVRILPDCDETIHLGRQNASYTFNKYAGGYAQNLDCSYVFRTEPGYQLQLDFRTFHLEETTACSDDYLEIRDGAGSFADIIGRFCGHELPPKLVSSRDALFLRFVSDEMLSDRGLEAVITALPTLCGSPLIKLEEKTQYELKLGIDEQGHYANNMFCYWKIMADRSVHLKFNSFDLEAPDANGKCEADYLKIYNSEDALKLESGFGKELVFNGANSERVTDHVYCGSAVPDDYYANSNVVYLRFRSNEAITKSGFSLTAMQADGCFRNFTALQGRIIIAETSSFCDIYIRAPVNYTLSLYYAEMPFDSYDCNEVSLEVFDAHTNSSLLKICSFMEPGKSLFSLTNELRLRLKTAGYYSNYDITYLASNQGPGCGGELYNTEGIFTNPFYPLNIRNNSECRWKVRVPSNTHVLLTFDVFNMGSKSTCHTDYLRILERNEAGDEQEMRRFCGEDSPKTYRSLRSELVVHFRKTVNYDGTGWVIRFKGIYATSVI